MQQLQILLQLALVGVLGYLAIRLKLIPETSVTVFNKFLANVGLPIFILNAIITTYEVDLKGYNSFLGINILVMLGIALLLFFILKLGKVPHKQLGAILLSTMLANVGYFGLPILEGVYGKIVLNFGAIYVLVFSFTVVVCTLLVEFNNANKVHIKHIFIRTLKNPVLIAAITGLIVLILNIGIPLLLLKSIGLVAQTVGPLSLITIGAFIAVNSQLKKIKVGLIVSALKLLVVPAIVYLVLLAWGGFSEITLTVSVIQAAMPIAFSVLPLASEYDLDLEIVSTATILSSMLFIASSLIWIYIL